MHKTSNVGRCVPKYIINAKLDESQRVNSLDYLMQTSYTSSEAKLKIRVRETDAVKLPAWSYFKLIMLERETLIEVIKSQKRLLDYNGYYNAFLLGQLSEEEFAEISNQFAYEPKEIGIEELTKKIDCLLSLTNLPYSASDLADLFECDLNNAKQILDSRHQIKQVEDRQ